MLNPGVANNIIKDIVMQLSYHYKNAPELAAVVKNLNGLNNFNSWGDLTQKAVDAAKPLKNSFNDIAPHVKNMVNLYNEPNANKVMGPEYVAPATGALAGAKAMLGTTLSPLVSLGAPIAAGVAGALAIRHAKNKFDKELDAGTANTLSRGDELIKAIRKQRNQGTPALGKVSGQQEAALRKSNPELFIAPVRNQFNNNTNYQSANRKFNAYGNWASNK